MKKKLELIRIENHRKVTPETDADFFRALQIGTLLELKERGTLSDIQFRAAEQRLRREMQSSESDD